MKKFIAFSSLILFVSFVFVYLKKTEAQIYLCLPIKMAPLYNEAIVEIKIEGVNHPLLVDLGCAFDLNIQTDILKKIKGKIELSNFKLGDVLGNSYDVQKFQIPLIQIGSWKIRNVNLVEEPDAYLMETISWVYSEQEKFEILKKEKEILHGKIGWPIFSQFACFFDFSNSTILLSKDFSLFKKKGYPIDRFIKIPFTLEKYGIILSATTDLGVQNFILDTGASVSFIAEHLVDLKSFGDLPANEKKIVSQSFILNGHDIGNWTLRPYPISHDNNSFHGILGMDFFKKHAVFFDFQNKEAYIEP